MDKLKLQQKLKGHIDSEKISDFPDNPDDTGWGDQVGVLISTNEAEYLNGLVEADLLKNG